jgi:hypothetical protein
MYRIAPWLLMVLLTLAVTSPASAQPRPSTVTGYDCATKWTHWYGGIDFCTMVTYRDAGPSNVVVTSVETCVMRSDFITTAALTVEPHIWNEQKLVYSKKVDIFLPPGLSDADRSRCAAVYPDVTLRRGGGNGVWTALSGTVQGCMIGVSPLGGPATVDCEPKKFDGDDRAWPGMDNI